LVLSLIKSLGSLLNLCQGGLLVSVRIEKAGAFRTKTHPPPERGKREMGDRRPRRNGGNFTLKVGNSKTQPIDS